MLTQRLLCWTLQFLVQATRQSAVTRQTATASVVINVLRNEYGPIFSQSNYFRIVDEKTPLGASIVQLTATDNNTGVSFSFFLVMLSVICKTFLPFFVFFFMC